MMSLKSFSPNIYQKISKIFPSDNLIFLLLPKIVNACQTSRRNLTDTHLWEFSVFHGSQSDDLPPPDHPNTVSYNLKLDQQSLGHERHTTNVHCSKN